MKSRRFAQVDVFTDVALRGNALAVVVDAEGLSDAQMQALACWTQLSETTFLLPPSDPAADYRLRIFTPAGELPFAGHPTLGSAHVWLSHGGVPRRADELVQQCGIGLVRVRRDGERLAFAAPPLRRSGPVDAALREQVARSLRLAEQDLLDVVWVANGPPWVGARLRSAAAVLALQPDYLAMQGIELGVVGAYPEGGPAQFEVRAFVPGQPQPEDPVTGSLNAGLAQWMMGAGLAPAAYLVSQGTALQRAGRVHVRRQGDDIWIGGDVTSLIQGQIGL
ncbi:PhzF family phenazine biosynthesis protein [Paucibacter soli]|uniref:PhzF family phenazine biosynthesis protein n=1 Tax=Paucibacter soli TaxID=3133433 RepID=UPI0030A3DB8A